MFTLRLIIIILSGMCLDTLYAQNDTVSERIVFGANIDDPRSMAVYELRPAGRGLKRLIGPSVQGRGEYHPHVSPDGRTLVFHKVTTPRAPYFDGDVDIYIINADGTGEKNLTPSADGDQTPSFSPDGKKIVFASRRDGNYEIYVMNRDGSSPTNLTNHKASDFAGSFSPDGGRIAFLSDREGVLNLYTMDADGSGLTCLTQDMAVSRSALKFDYSINWHFTTNWSRDGARIVFSGPGVDDKNDIYIFDLSKKMLRNITSSPDDEKHPVWAYYRE